MACHPFPVDEAVDPGISGKTDKGVLFHNGFWHQWKDKLIETAIRGYLPLPGGPWTDSRGIAWMTAHLGYGFLDLLDEKVLYFTPKAVFVYGSGWSMVNGVYCSNRLWEETVFSGGGHHNMGFYQLPTGRGGTEGTGGSSHGGSFRGAGAATQGAEDQQKRVQTAHTGDAGTGMAKHNGASQEETKEETVKVCIDCKTARASIWYHGDGTLGRCVACWGVYRKGQTITGTVFLEDACLFCDTMTRFRTVDENIPICAACYIKMGKPAVETARKKDVEPASTVEQTM
jgi:hypothetical protein